MLLSMMHLKVLHGALLGHHTGRMAETDEELPIGFVASSSNFSYERRLSRSRNVTILDIAALGCMLSSAA